MKVGEQSGQSDRGAWKVAQYLLETKDMFPKKVVFDVSDGLDGRIAKWDAYVGMDVNVRFDINAREHNGRWFNTIKGFAITQI